MLNRYLPSFLTGSLAFLMYVFNTVFCALVILLPFGLLKIIARKGVLRRVADRALQFMVFAWSEINKWTDRVLIGTEWEITGADNLSKDEWYLILLNHQSWVDIMAMLEAFNGRIPSPKFFIKRELIWLPIIGLSAWALDFPFMRRYTESFLRKNPEQRGKDIAETHQACLKFKNKPIAVCSFVEGTRFTVKKHQQKKSPYKHLLRPKAGGVGFVMGAMGDILHKILDVTIIFPNGKKNFWQYLSGQTKKVVIKIDEYPITNDLVGDYFNDRAYKEHFQQWLNTIWENKDKTISDYLNTVKHK